MSSLSVSRSLSFALSSLAVLLLAAPASGQETPPAAVVLAPVRVELTAGEVRNLRIDLDGALEPGLLYKAELPARKPSRDRVTLGFLDPDVPERPRHGGVPLQGELGESRRIVGVPDLPLGSSGKIMWTGTRGHRRI